MLETLKNIATLIAFGLASPFGFNIGTEEPHYQTIQKFDGDIEIREYGERIAAETIVTGKPAEQARSEGFEIIAGYIFGKNVEGKNISMTSPVEIGSKGKVIAMTSPVEVGPSSDSMLMRFFMPAEYKIATLPIPKDSRVKLVTVPKAHFAALKFSGSTSENALATQSEKLLGVIKTTRWKPAGPVHAYFYNPPWTIPFLRRNEVVVEVNTSN